MEDRDQSEQTPPSEHVEPAEGSAAAEASTAAGAGAGPDRSSTDQASSHRPDGAQADNGGQADTGAADDAETSGGDADAVDDVEAERQPERPAGPSLPRPLLAVIIGLPVLLAVGVAAMGLILGNGSSGSEDTPDVTRPQQTGPLALGPVPAPAAGSAECTTLLNGLPQQLTSNGAALPRRELATPAPAGALGWGDTQHDPVILRCGLDRPAELTLTSALRDVSGVRWLVVEGEGAATWYVVDRPVYVALTVPNDAGTGPLQDVSAAVRDTLPAVEVRTSG